MDLQGLNTSSFLKPSYLAQVAQLIFPEFFNIRKIPDHKGHMLKEYVCWTGIEIGSHGMMQLSGGLKR